MSEEEIKQMFEKFSGKFEETIFTLISKFNEINDSLNRVQEALDYLEKIRIQTAENKQVMSNVNKSYKALEKRLREMSMDGFILPEGIPQEPVKTEEFLSMPASSTKTEIEDDLSDLGVPEELPSVEDLKSVEKPISPPETAPAPAPQPSPKIPSEPMPPPVTSSEPEITPPPAPIPTPAPEPEAAPEPISEPESEPTPELTPKPIPPPLPDHDITPPPKFEAAPELSEESVSVPSPPAVEGGYTPPPTPKSGISVPAMNPNSATHIRASPLPRRPSNIASTYDTGQKAPAEDEKIPDPKGPSDVWHNLIIDIKKSQTNEDIALSLAQANDHLKKFVKFDKVLFKILKLAGGYRRKGTIGKPNEEEKQDIIKEIGNWKIEFKVR